MPPASILTKEGGEGYKDQGGERRRGHGNGDSKVNLHGPTHRYAYLISFPHDIGQRRVHVFPDNSSPSSPPEPASHIPLQLKMKCGRDPCYVDISPCSMKTAPSFDSLTK